MKTLSKIIIFSLLVSGPVGAVLLITPTPLDTAIKPPMTVTINGIAQTNGIASIIKDNQAAIQLGKALFWDTAIGSDGMACASCHFHAGTDSRTNNQITPGFNHNPDPEFTANTYQALPGGTVGAAAQLTVRDFPLFRFTGLDSQNTFTNPRFIATLIDDVVGSTGSQNGVYQSSLAGSNNDFCLSRAHTDPAQKDGLNVRKATGRNAPSVINATFNVRNFWDGRANKVFNGRSPFGLRDVNARVWRNNGGTPAQVKIEIDNASLASQAVGPVLNDNEMSCSGRTFEHVGTKIMSRVPLATQVVSVSDSVLGILVTKTKAGTFISPQYTYRSLVQAAFNSEWWTGSTGTMPLDEANFPLFFGLAIQAYEDTLRSNQSKFDLIPRTLQGFTPHNGGGAPIATAPLPVRLADGTFKGLTKSESRGLDIFMGTVSLLNPIGKTAPDPITGLTVAIPVKNGNCIACHNGPEFTSAAFTALAPAPTGVTLVPGKVAPEFSAEPMPFIPVILPDTFVSVFNPKMAFGTYDLGFYDVGVTPLNFDHGLGGNDPFGNPLAFARQWEKAFLTLPVGEKCPDSPLGVVLGGAVCSPPVTVDTFTVNVNFVDNLTLAPLRMTPSLSPAKTDGSFKTPSLRNVELTAPYFHNGSAKTLEEALTMYNNGGLFINQNHHPAVIPLGFDATDITDIFNFLLTLTDPRVKLEQAPFDHPALPIPNGHLKNATTGKLVAKSGTSDADDLILNLPETGKKGSALAPASFVQKLAP